MSYVDYSGLYNGVMRGERGNISRSHAVARALSAIAAVPKPPAGAPDNAGQRPIAYRLHEANGGRDPFAGMCSDWSYGNRTPTADCIGFALWASQLDRCQPKYNGSRGEWLNCAALLDDAYGMNLPKGTFPYQFGMDIGPVSSNTTIRAARPGDWCLTPDHIGIIIRVTRYLGSEDHPMLLLVDCSPRHGRNTAINTGLPWSEQCRIVRPVHYNDD